MNKANQKCAFIALIGAPNAGKSTLLNELIGAKVAIVTPKVQTTRTIMNGICIEGDAQLIFVDTPGLFNAGNKLEKSMVKTAWSGIESADHIALLVDAKKGVTENVIRIISMLGDRKIKATLILNKIDLIKKEILLPLADELFKAGNFEDVFMISALKGNGVKDIKKVFSSKASTCPWLYDKDEITTAPARFLASEITREKLFQKLNKELPYSISVETEGWEEKKDGSIKVQQVIYVKKKGQKKIVLGKSGQFIKDVGERSRKEIGYLLDKKIHLFLFVKVKEDWDSRPEIYQYMGMQF